MKKSKLSSDQKFLAIAFVKFSLLQFLFAGISAVFMGDGYGTEISFLIFYSWFSVLALNYFQNYFALFAASAFFLVTLLILSATWHRILDKKRLIILNEFHFFGIAVGVVFCNIHHSSFLQITLAAISVSLVASFFFWRIFFQVADYRLKHPSAIRKNKTSV